MLSVKEQYVIINSNIDAVTGNNVWLQNNL